MSKTQRQPFTPRGPFVVGRGFIWSGKPYSEGEAFPHNRLAIDHRKLRQLWDQRRLNVDVDYLPSDDEVKEAEALATLAAAEDQATTVGEENTNAPAEPKDNAQGDESNEDPALTFSFDPAEHLIEKEGREYWIADAEVMLVRVRAETAKLLEDALEVTLVTADQILEWPDAEEA